MHQHCKNYAQSHAAAGNGLPSIEPGMPLPAGTGMSRRKMVLGSLGLGMAVYGAGAISAPERIEAAINEALGEHKVVISVFFDGGWDALSVLAPFGTDHKHEARLNQLRPTLSGAIDRGASSVFSADPSLSWHPSAEGLKSLWDNPDVGVAVAPAVGYPGANYSHFTSRHFWEVGALDTGGTTGWMGRYLDRVGKLDVPIQGISMGGQLSPAQATDRVPVAAVSKLENLAYWYPGSWGPTDVAATAQLRALGKAPTADPQLATARMVTDASFGVLESLSAVASAPTTATDLYGVVTPSTPLPNIAKELASVAKMLDTRVNNQALPVRCISLRAQGGYDTHTGQNPGFSNGLKANFDAIKNFWTDLKNRGEDDRVVMIVWSEFGRRPLENADAGCDHGAAGTAFVIGKTVKQGLIGEFPGLVADGTTNAGLMKDGNLRATSDFRAIYSAILEQWLDTDAGGIIPGAGARPGPGSGYFVRPQLL